MIPTRGYRTLSFSETPTHEEDFRDLVVAATRGDLCAASALADAFYPTLVAEAAAVLDPWQRAHAEDVVNDFFVSICEGRNRFVPKKHDAVTWMVRIVRAIDQTRRREESRMGGYHRG